MVANTEVRALREALALALVALCEEAAESDGYMDGGIAAIKAACPLLGINLIEEEKEGYGLEGDVFYRMEPSAADVLAALRGKG